MSEVLTNEPAHEYPSGSEFSPKTNHETKPAIDLEQHRQKLETNARNKLQELPPGQSELNLPVDDSSQGSQPQYVDRVIQAIALKTELSNIRQHLSFGQKLFSKTIHQPFIRTASELSAKSVARPSGLLGGGIFAFLGSLAYLLFAKYIGLSYNYLLAVLFFVFGFIVGVCIEFILSHFETPAD